MSGRPNGPALRPVRFSLRELEAEVREERRTSALASQLVDQREIERLFRNPRERRRKSNG